MFKPDPKALGLSWESREKRPQRQQSCSRASLSSQPEAWERFPLSMEHGGIQLFKVSIHFLASFPQRLQLRRNLSFRLLRVLSSLTGQRIQPTVSSQIGARSSASISNLIRTRAFPRLYRASHQGAESLAGLPPLPAGLRSAERTCSDRSSCAHTEASTLKVSIAR